MSTTPWRVEWTNFGESIGYDSRSRIVDAEGNWVAEIGDGVWDRIAQHEALASLIVSAVNECESQAAQIAELTAERDLWVGLYRRAINEANGLTNYVEDRPELRSAEKRLSAIEAAARASLNPEET